MNIEQRIDKLEQELNELKKQAKSCKPKYWKPKGFEDAWYIHGGKVRFDSEQISAIDKETIAIGDVFKTREEAEKELKLRLATQRLKEAIWEANGGEFIGFVPDVLNTTINAHNNILQVDSYTYAQNNQDWIYIKDQKTAENVLEENRKDFEVYYGLNK